jgi:hypothetical protein
MYKLRGNSSGMMAGRPMMEKVMKRIFWVVGFSTIALVALIGTGYLGLAQNVPAKKPPTPPTRAATTAPAPAAPAPAGAPNAMVAGAAEVTGFRTALFGMTEAQVRTAIEKDFRVKADAITSEDNKVEQTRVLAVRVPDVLPGGGTADVSYVFGFKSKTLIQTSVTWSKATDEKMTPEQLFSNANVLRSHFINAGYKPETVATNMPINSGILMFRGNDDHDRATMLILQGTLTQGENNQRVLTPTTLLLFYIADAKSPDVYRLPPGSF